MDDATKAQILSRIGRLTTPFIMNEVSPYSILNYRMP